MSARALVLGTMVVVSLLAVRPAGAEMYRLQAPDGTIHYTNAPTDPRYQRLGFTSGTAQGWLRVPGGAERYASTIRETAERYGVSERLVSAVIRVESDFNPRAVSRSGARGLMQLMPATASGLGVRDSFDPRQNIDGGVRHLRWLLDRLGNLSLALAAYNAGERAVLTHGGIPPYRETQDYVTRVLRFFDGGERASAHPSVTYRVVEPDGTLVYTNIPPHGRR
ncbi:MAG TPA: lytic transglycosylase domain-containing protein [Vicinamibacteria bacterium]|nr:lytic transglycosylase domain-containing protein [Vicinamibacteria bacterium]